MISFPLFTVFIYQVETNVEDSYDIVMEQVYTAFVL